VRDHRTFSVFTSLSEGYLVSISKASHLCGPMICPGGTRIQISSVQSPQRFPQSVCPKAYHVLKSPRARGASRSVNPISAELALRGGSGPLVIFPSWRHRIGQVFCDCRTSALLWHLSTRQSSTCIVVVLTTQAIP